ncbi:MAG: hypothetical protein AAF985_05595 [Bacteroidota bacterium]
MDYFNENFNIEDGHRHEDLPNDLEWEQMKEGIYGRMEQPSPKSSKNRWPFLLLLLFSGCGTGSWLALNYFNQETSKAFVVVDKEQKESTKQIDSASAIAPTTTDETKKDIPNKKISEGITESTKKRFNKNKTKSNFKFTKQERVTQNLRSSKQNDQGVTFETTEERKQINKTEDNSTKQTSDLKIQNPKNTVEVSKLKLVGIAALPSYAFGMIPFTRDLPATFQNPRKQHFKTYLEVSVAGGLTNWLAADPQNINHDYVSGYPGWSFTPTLSIFFKPNQALQIDYEYATFEELFDYDGSRPIQVYQEDVIVREVINSLTGDLIRAEREDVVLNGTRSYREIKYNRYQLHTLSLGYRFLQSIGNKSSLGVYGGVAYLFSLQSEGKRLDEHFDVIAFNRSNPLFSGHQLGLRFALSYNFKIGPNTQVFSRVNGTKYLSNWELKDSPSATRPLVYGIQIGLRKNITR